MYTRKSVRVGMVVMSCFVLAKGIICPWPSRERIQWKRKQSYTHPYRRHQMEVCYTLRSGRFIPGEERRYQLNRKHGGFYSLSGRFEEQKKKKIAPARIPTTERSPAAVFSISHYERIPVILRLYRSVPTSAEPSYFVTKTSKVSKLKDTSSQH